MKHEVLGVGSLLLDQILPVEEEFLETIPGKKGGMQLITHRAMEEILRKSPIKPTPIAGGSGTNTIKGLANFGHACAFAGKLGADENGRLIRQNLQKLDVVPLIRETETPTGQALCMVTPDKERTMRTNPGAASEMRGADLDPAWFKGVSLVHLEGYTLLNEDLADRAITLAKEAGAKISFDLASFEIASAFKEKIIHLLSRHIDILFANKEETKTLTGLDPERGIHLLCDMCDTVVIYMGDQGGWVGRNNEKVRYPAFKADPLDTTGAGDLFASGFLHGCLENLPLEECARLGALTGSTVVGVMGAEIPPELWEQIKSKQL